VLQDAEPPAKQQVEQPGLRQEGEESHRQPGRPPIRAQERLRLATTTSTENTGLLGFLIPTFEKQFNLKVEVVAVGSGQALKLAENGDADVVLSHAPPLEDAFIANGFGVNRRSLMYNDHHRRTARRSGWHQGREVQRPRQTLATKRRRSCRAATSRART
jgi:hypothetical protein